MCLNRGASHRVGLDDGLGWDGDDGRDGLSNLADGGDGLTGRVDGGEWDTDALDGLAGGVGGKESGQGTGADWDDSLDNWASAVGENTWGEGRLLCHGSWARDWQGHVSSWDVRDDGCAWASLVGDGALVGAVGDCDPLAGGGSVCLLVLDEGGGRWAEGDISGDCLGGIDSGAVVIWCCSDLSRRLS